MSRVRSCDSGLLHADRRRSKPRLRARRFGRKGSGTEPGLTDAVGKTVSCQIKLELRYCGIAEVVLGQGRTYDPFGREVLLAPLSSFGFCSMLALQPLTCHHVTDLALTKPAVMLRIQNMPSAGFLSRNDNAFFGQRFSVLDDSSEPVRVHLRRRRQQ